MFKWIKKLLVKDFATCIKHITKTLGDLEGMMETRWEMIDDINEKAEALAVKKDNHLKEINKAEGTYATIMKFVKLS